MKNRVLIVVACLVLSALILMLLPSAHPQTDPTDPSMQQPSSTVTPTTSLPAAPGVVRIYSCNEQWLAAFDTLAAQYTALTGTQVVVLRPDEDGCEATLARLMVSKDAPVMLCMHSKAQLNTWQDKLFDLQGSALAAELVSSSFGLHSEDGALLGIAVDLEAFGLLVNAEVLGVALSRSDIQDMSSLTTAAQIMKSNSIKAFPAPVLDAEDLLQLGNSSNAAGLRAFLNLYAAYCAGSGTPMEQFLNGKCAFYLGGTWDYEALAVEGDHPLQARNLDILPTFATGALQYSISTAWCFNGGAKAEDLEATLKFMTWLVSAGEDGTAPIDSMQMLTPFSQASWYGTHLEKKLLTYMRTEPAMLQWALDGKDNSKLALALQEYIRKPSDDAWNKVEAYLTEPQN